MSRPIKGLMIKDLRLVFSQMKLFFVIMAVWGIFMAVNIEQFYFVPAYTSVFCTFISLSTYSYDEFENGTAYLFTLPIRRRDYVRAKYLLGILFMMVPTIVITFAACVAGMVTKGEAAVWEYFAATVTSIGIALVLLAVENPLYIRFGQEKSRIFKLVSFGIIGGGLGAIGSLVGESADGMSVISSILGLDLWMLMLLMAAVSAVLVCVSYCISCAMIEKKQY